MANAIQITVVGLNQVPNTTLGDVIVSTNGLVVVENTYGISGANCTVIVPKTPTGGGFNNYQVSETMAALLLEINADTTVDLSNVGTFTTSGFATFGAGQITKRTAVAINATNTMADGDMKLGYITSTSAAATAITTRTATQLATELGATAGATYEFVVNNVSGASTVTITPGAGLTAASAITGGTDMTIAATEIAAFRIVFVSTTVAQISRIH